MIIFGYIVLGLILMSLFVSRQRTMTLPEFISTVMIIVLALNAAEVI